MGDQERNNNSDRPVKWAGKRPTDKELRQILADHKAWYQGGGRKPCPHDLSQIDLAGFNLNKIDLRGANLQDARIDGANLHNTNLDGTDFQRASLRDAQLDDSNLRKAKLCGADLRRANLQGSRLPEANLRDADLRAADLSNANLETSQGLEPTNLGGCRLEETKLHNAILSNVINLTAEQLGGADTTGAELPLKVGAFETVQDVAKLAGFARKLFSPLIIGCAFILLTVFATNDTDLVTNRASTKLPIILAAVPMGVFYCGTPIILFFYSLYFHVYLIRVWQRLAVLPAVFPDGSQLWVRADPWFLLSLFGGHIAKRGKPRPKMLRLAAFGAALLAWLMPLACFFFVWLRYLPQRGLTWSLVQVGWFTVASSLGLIAVFFGSTTLARKHLAEKRRVLSLVVLAVLTLGLFLGWLSWSALSGPPRGAERTWAAGALTWVGRPPYADMTSADLQGVKLPGANLQWADLGDARMQDVDLRLANLQYARLRMANLKGAKLEKADLRGADLTRADLQDADLRGANLEGADIRESDLRTARGLSCEQVRAAWVDASTLLPPEIEHCGP